jgi:hypothetical protein
MDSQTRIGLEVLGAALVLGILGDLLLRATPWGLNAFLWTVLLGATACVLTWRWGIGGSVLTRPWMLLFLATPLLYVWRDAPMLKLVTTLALLGALGIAVRRAQLLRSRTPEGLIAPPGLLGTTARAVLGFPGYITREIEWRVLPADGRGEAATAAARGLIFASPALLVFGILFASADAAFAQLVAMATDVNLGMVPSHIILTVGFAWVAGGVLRGMVTDVQRPDTLAEIPESGTAPRSRLLEIGATETAIVIGLINLLFGVFVAIQLRYLFGGIEVVASTEGLTLAAYARRGFFELVTVAGLALTLLSFLHRNVHPQTLRQQRVIRGLANAQIMLLLIILASAAQRMWLYQEVYGLTVLRVYVSAMLMWLAFVLPAFVLTVLRGYGERFVPSALAAGLVMVLGLHILNPDALIARTNVARAFEGKSFDARYAASLSADAVPVLLDALPMLSEEDQRIIAASLRQRWDVQREGDWRTWSQSRGKALEQIAGDVEQFAQLAPPPVVRERPVNPRIRGGTVAPP